MEAHQGTMVGRNGSWMNVCCSVSDVTILYCTGSITVHDRLDNFTLILLELRARHRQSLCVISCIALAFRGFGMAP